MISKRQLQDLAKQLAYTRQQLNHFQSVPMDGVHLDNSGYNFSSHISKLDSHRNKRQKPAVIHDFSRARKDITTFGRGIFKTPNSPHGMGPLSQSSASLPELPPKHVADDLLQHYQNSIQLALPILHWPSFIQSYESIYREYSAQYVPRIQRALLFVVLAFSSLRHSLQSGQVYLERSKGLVDFWTEDLNIDHVRCALLSSLFLIEMNIKSAGWAWLGYSIRIAQDIGLHSDISSETGNRSPAEQEMRKRIWWSIYAYDRSVYIVMKKERRICGLTFSSLLSLELGKPPMVNDEDCEIDLPATMDDMNVRPEITWTSPSVTQSSSSFLATLWVSRKISVLLKVIKLPTLPPAAIQNCDLQFNDCMATFPAHHQPRRTEVIDPRTIAPVIYLQNARLVLHRHNLTTMCTTDVRSAAMLQCVIIAQDTAQLLSRCLMNPPIASDLHLASHNMLKTHLESSAIAFFCTHVWRCTLFLCLRADFQSALICARVSAIIGDTRPINMACGRYMAFFLDRLIEKMQHDAGAYIDSDEELIAYVSGDLQGRPEHSWIWHDSEESQKKSLEEFNMAHIEEGDRKVAMEPNMERASNRVDWDKMLERLNRLALEDQEEQRQKLAQSFPQTMPGKPMHSAVSIPGHTQGIPVSSSRISIADIM